MNDLEKTCYVLWMDVDEPYSEFTHIVSVFKTKEAAESEKKYLEEQEEQKEKRYNSIKDEMMKYEDYIYKNDLDDEPDGGVEKTAKHFNVPSERVQEILDEPYFHKYNFWITEQKYINK